MELDVQAGGEAACEPGAVWLKVELGDGAVLHEHGEPADTWRHRSVEKMGNIGRARSMSHLLQRTPPSTVFRSSSRPRAWKKV